MYELTATLFEDSGALIDTFTYAWPTEDIPDEVAAREEMRQVWHWYNVAYSMECRWGEVVVRDVEAPVMRDVA
jgi:hypothetical protein